MDTDASPYNEASLYYEKWLKFVLTEGKKLFVETLVLLSFSDRLLFHLRLLYLLRYGAQIDTLLKLVLFQKYYVLVV